MTTQPQSFEPGTVGAALAAAGSLDRDTIAGLVDGEVLDLQTALPAGATPAPVRPRDEEALHVLRHSAAHVMADAVQRLFPGTKVTIGPSIETGFYYDFDRPDGAFTEDDLAKIEAEMLRIAGERLPFERRVVTRDEARALFDELGERYKLEILDGIPEGEPVTLYRHGEWVDLCAGPHLPDTSRIRTVKLLATAGAYWRGDERNKMLSRIYGTAFFDKKDLKRHLLALEEAKKRDHRKLGKELELFSVDDEIGGGLVLWHPRGALVRMLIEDHWRKAHLANGYDLLFTPHIGRAHLWQTSGHLENYAESMYAPMEIEGNPYYIKPMNCPFHIGVYRSTLRSYRDLPLRWAELGTVYRHERSGQLHGLLRVRGFTQDDAHLFMRPDQLAGEIRRLLRFTMRLLGDFGFDDLEVRLSTRPEKHIGSLEIWDRAEGALREGLEAEQIDYKLDPGEGTFYGPKIDIKIRDAIGRLWQCSTTQVDFNLPERFDLAYIGEDSKRHRPVMLHRTFLGSMERFFGVLVEHHAGAFPLARPRSDRAAHGHRRPRRFRSARGRSAPGRRRAGGARPRQREARRQDPQGAPRAHPGDGRDRRQGGRGGGGLAADAGRGRPRLPGARRSGGADERGGPRARRDRLEWTGPRPLREAGAEPRRWIIRGRRRFQRQPRPQKERINEMIRRPEVRVINPEGKQLGIYPIHQAVAIAQELGLDLVEINPKADPPVCRIMDYGKYKYEQKKQASAAKKKQKVIEVKEVKMRPKTDDHDFDFKVKHVRRFLEEGNKAKLTIRFRGREMAHPETAARQLDKVVEVCKDIGEVEQPYKMEGRTMTMVLAPIKT